MYNNLSTQVVEISQKERFEAARDKRLASKANAQRSGRLALPSMDVGDLSAQLAQWGRAVWWVPAGFAVLVLLYAIIGA